eukprot:gene16621-19744_t
MNRLTLSLFLAIAMIATAVYGHGYALRPLARHQICAANSNNNIWYPEDGSGVKEPSCSAAFQHVYQKSGAGAARIQYVQNNEYAVMIPNYPQGYSALTAAVPNNLCSAHAINAGAGFGDKSGFSIPANWKPNVVNVASTSVQSQTIDFVWCATAAHDPSFWEFYVSKPGYNYATSMLTWDDVTLLHSEPNGIPVTMGKLEGCSADKYYQLALTVPARFDPATILVRWQRIDAAGECFMNCIDYQFNANGQTP